MSFKRVFHSVCIIVFIVSFTNAYGQRHKHHKYHRHTPNYYYSKLPRWGFSYKTAPQKSVIIVHAGTSYHFHSGIFYKSVGAKYKIVRAPLGLRIKTLPNKRISLIVRGKKYFYYYGTFYTKEPKSNEYIVVDPPLGARINALPDGYKEIEKNGDIYYAFEGVLYKEVTTTDDEIWYEVVEIKD